MRLYLSQLNSTLVQTLVHGIMRVLLSVVYFRLVTVCHCQVQQVLFILFDIVLVMMLLKPRRNGACPPTLLTHFTHNPKGLNLSFVILPYPVTDHPCPPPLPINPILKQPIQLINPLIQHKLLLNIPCL